MAQGAVVCVQCGAPAGKGESYCPFCGKPTVPGAVICTSCGRALNTAAAVAPGQDQKSKTTAGLLGIFLGAAGVHNFYLGYTGKAIAQLSISIAALLLDCVFGIGAFIHPIPWIWGLIEGILILTGSINKDGKGVPLKD